MRRFGIGRGIAGIAAAAVALMLSACATKPPPPPPPPPVVVVIPPRPYPPMGAPTNLPIPALGVDGTRHTINSGLSPKQAAWNLRSAYNVAALNCQKPEHAPILANYGDFLKANKTVLAKINSDLDKHFKTQYGSDYIRAREAFQTQVYNYFALPPVVPAFCDAALSMGQELRAVPSDQLEGYSAMPLARIEAVFQEFFNSYDQYRADLAAWEARYGAGPVAASAQVHGAVQ